MRLLALVLVLAAAAPASAAQVMVVGRSETLVEPRAAALKVARAKVEGRRCRFAARTALAELVRLPVKLTLRDYGACGSKPADAAGVYVIGVAGEKERGRGGWVYKVGDRSPSVGAADPAGRFKRSARVLWFWCRDAGDCQRTLSVRPDRTTAAPGETLRVRVRAHDDEGRAIPGAGATVTLGSAQAVAGDDGVAEVTVPEQRGTLRLVATKAKLVRSFPAKVEVR